LGETHKKKIIIVLYILLPLTAVIVLGASSYLWYKTLRPEAIKIPEIIPPRISTETFSSGLEANLLAVLSDNGIEKSNVKVSVADISFKGIKKIYDVNVPENFSLTLLNVRINTMAHEMGGEIFQCIESSDGKTLTIKVGSGRTATDIIILRKMKGIQVAKAKIAIIVDDLGIKSLDLAKRLCNLKQVVTLSILPFQHLTSEVVELMRETGTPYILHMPMEPKSTNANPGEGAIYTGDTESQILEKLTRAFKSVRGAPGLNNHMGSKATEDVRIMEIIMEYMNENSYFFVDSRTSNNSKGYSLSQKMGVKGAELYTYLDVEDDKDFINKRLDNLADAAFENGLAVGICHDRPNTIEVLEQRLPELEEKNITFVKVSDIVR